MCLASSEICVARNARASCDGAAIANGSSSVVTRSSPRKNEERLHCMNSRCSSVKASDSQSARSSREVERLGAPRLVLPAREELLVRGGRLDDSVERRHDLVDVGVEEDLEGLCVGRHPGASLPSGSMPGTLLPDRSVNTSAGGGGPSVGSAAWKRAELTRRQLVARGTLGGLALTGASLAFPAVGGRLEDGRVRLTNLVANPRAARSLTGWASSVPGGRGSPWCGAAMTGSAPAAPRSS